jgi:hypothetical protein
VHIVDKVLDFGVSIDYCVSVLLCAHYRIIDVNHEVHGHCLCGTMLCV